MHLVSDSGRRSSSLARTCGSGWPRAICAETSYKYRPDELGRLVQPVGFRQQRQWIQSQRGFALTLFARLETAFVFDR